MGASRFAPISDPPLPASLAVHSGHRLPIPHLLLVRRSNSRIGETTSRAGRRLLQLLPTKQTDQMVAALASFLSLFLFFPSSSSTATFFPAFLPSNNTALHPPPASPDPNPAAVAALSPPAPPPPSFLKAVVDAISAKERWDRKAETRVSGWSQEKAKIGASQRYEFLLKVDRTALALRFQDEVVTWRKAAPGDPPVVEELGSDFVAGEAAAGAVRPLELVGPLDLRVGLGGDGDRLSVHLPASNNTLTGIRQIYVGIGIKINIEGAQEVSLVHPYDIGLSLDGTLSADISDQNYVKHLGYSSCTPLLMVHLMGPASITAYTAHNGADNIVATYKSHDTLELLPTKCYNKSHMKPISSCSFYFISPRLALLENLLRSFLGSKAFQNKSIRFLKAKISPSSLVKFNLELERDITRNDPSWKKLPEWKYKPRTERVWLEIVARVEGERRLKPILVKLKRPFAVAVSIDWSSLSSNISFTQFPSLVVPPEELTLDVKW